MKRPRRDWKSRRRKVADNLVFTVLFLTIGFFVVVAIRTESAEPKLDDMITGATALLREILEWLRPIGNALARALRWCTRNATWLGDLATWLTGAFTFAAFYLAWRIFRQGRTGTRELKQIRSQSGPIWTRDSAPS